MTSLKTYRANHQIQECPTRSTFRPRIHLRAVSLTISRRREDVVGGISNPRRDCHIFLNERRYFAPEHTGISGQDMSVSHLDFVLLTHHWKRKVTKSARLEGNCVGVNVQCALSVAPLGRKRYKIGRLWNHKGER